jgi:hypothetical protein
LFGVRRISKPRESNIIMFDERGLFSTNGKHKIMGRQRQNGPISGAKESVIQRSRDSDFCCITITMG